MLFGLSVEQAVSTVVVRPLPKIDVPGVIQLTRIVQPQEPLLLNGKVEDEISPDQEHFFLITRRQDIALNKNIYRLVLFDTKGLEKTVSRDGRSLAGRVLVETGSSSQYVFEHAIRSARWLNNAMIVFLAEIDDSPTQVFTVDVVTGQITQITHHSSPVLAFAYDLKSHVVVYIAREPVENDYMHRASFIAGNSSLTRILFPDNLPTQHLIYRYYRSFVGKAASIKPLGKPFEMSRSPPLMSLSPNGRWVITRSTPRNLADSKRFVDTYMPMRDVLRPYLANDEDPDSLFTEGYSSLVMQMRIFDIQTGEEMPWFDVPDGTSIGREWPFASWLPDGKSVVIANTYLPLDGVDEAERRRRRSVPALIEYWPANGRFIKIADLSAARLSFQGLYSNAAVPGVVYLKENRAITAFRRKDAGWVRDDAIASSIDSLGRVRGRLRLGQSANESPDILFRTRNGREIRVTDLNPQLRKMDIGRVEPFAWRDESGREWRGGLLLPSDFDRKRRYPLVIQLGGFSQDQFYIDGARHIASAMAGRAYLREGILVLLEPGDYLKTGDQRKELFVHAEGIKAAIDRLTSDGMIDPDRVGIVGFSARGSIAQHIITFANIKIRAATMADAALSSLFSSTAYFYGFYKPSMLTIERRLEAKPWGESAATWARRDPSLHTDCIEAAVRYEFYNLYAYPGWESYALLRRQYKPVEAIIFPGGAHQLRRPQERLDSLQGNVDWFRFWLKDEEDADVAKEAQYRRWREMKARAPHVLRDRGCMLLE